jgi:hypothetical protein
MHDNCCIHALALLLTHAAYVASSPHHRPRHLRHHHLRRLKYLACHVIAYILHIAAAAAMMIQLWQMTM